MYNQYFILRRDGRKVGVARVVWYFVVLESTHVMSVSRSKFFSIVNDLNLKQETPVLESNGTEKIVFSHK